MQITHKNTTDIPINHKMYIHKLKMKSAQRRAKLDRNWLRISSYSTFQSIDPCCCLFPHQFSVHEVSKYPYCLVGSSLKWTPRLFLAFSLNILFIIVLVGDRESICVTKREGERACCLDILSSAWPNKSCMSSKTSFLWEWRIGTRISVSACVCVRVCRSPPFYPNWCICLTKLISADCIRDDTSQLVSYISGDESERNAQQTPLI
jgi:hypothetical protein